MNSKAITEYLNLKLGEKFRVKGIDDKIFFFTENDCCYSHEKEKAQYSVSPAMLGMLIINPEFVIKGKPPWEPSYGEPYYYVAYTLATGGYTSSDMWKGTDMDYARYHIGNCFETNTDAENHIGEMLGAFEKINREKDGLAYLKW